MEQDRCAYKTRVVAGVQIEMFEVVFEDVVRPVSNCWTFLAVECLYDPYSPNYLVIITKNFANLPFFLLKTNPLGTEHLPLLRENLKILL